MRYEHETFTHIYAYQGPFYRKKGKRESQNHVGFYSKFEKLKDTVTYFHRSHSARLILPLHPLLTT